VPGRWDPQEFFLVSASLILLVYLLLELSLWGPYSYALSNHKPCQSPKFTNNYSQGGLTLGVGGGGSRQVFGLCVHSDTVTAKAMLTRLLAAKSEGGKRKDTVSEMTRPCEKSTSSETMRCLASGAKGAADEYLYQQQYQHIAQQNQDFSFYCVWQCGHDFVQLEVPPPTPGG